MSNIYHTEPPTAGKVLIHTSFGDIDIELWSKECPLACRNFIQLALEGYFDGTLVNRVLKGFMVQFGDPTNTGSGGESIWGRPFKDEVHGRIKFNHRGQVAMANSNKPNSNQSQFFITLDNCDWLQGKHTIFGKVTGNTIYNVLRMGEVEVGENDHPVGDIRVLNVEVLWNPFDDIVPRAITKVQPTEQSKGPIKPQGSAKAIKNSKLLSFAADDDDAEEEVPRKIVMKSVHEAKAKQHQTVLAYAAPDADQRLTSSNEAKSVKKRKYDDTEQLGADNFDIDDTDYYPKQQPASSSSSSASSRQRLLSTADNDDDILLDRDAISLMMKKSKRETGLQQKSQEFLLVRDELLRSRRAVHVLTGSEAVTAEKDMAFHEMVTPLEQRRLKYMKRKADHGDRADETLKKLEAFKHALKATKQSVKVEEVAAIAPNAEIYHGQVLEKDSDDEGEDDKVKGKDWFAGKLKFKKHIDDQYRNGQQRDDGLEVIDPRQIDRR